MAKTGALAVLAISALLTIVACSGDQAQTTVVPQPPTAEATFNADATAEARVEKTLTAEKTKEAKVAIAATLEARAKQTTPAPTATAQPKREPTATRLAPTATPAPKATPGPTDGQRHYSNPPPMSIDVTAGYTATIHTNYGSFKVVLLPSQAPIAVNNFVFLSRDGFYDGVTFHRVIEGFMIQGGDPTGAGAGGPGYQFQDEIVEGLIFDSPGKLAMANAGAGTSTNGSQFFVTTVPAPHLNGAHTIFGEVMEGQDVVNAISRVETDGRDRPLQPAVIESISITDAPPPTASPAER